MGGSSKSPQPLPHRSELERLADLEEQIAELRDEIEALRVGLARCSSMLLSITSGVSCPSRSTLTQERTDDDDDLERA